MHDGANHLNMSCRAGLNDLIFCVDGKPFLQPAPPSGLPNEERLISLVLQLPTGEAVLHIIEQVHDVSVFLSWVAKVAWHLRNDAPPRYLPKCRSLAAAVESFYEDASNSELDIVEEDLFQYRSHHDLRFAFRGTDVPSVLIGRWQGEVTLSSTANGGYSYPIDLRKFLTIVGG